MICQIVSCENEAHYTVKVEAGAEISGTHIEIFVCKDCLLRMYCARRYCSEEEEEEIMEDNKIKETIGFMLLPPAPKEDGQNTEREERATETNEKKRRYADEIVSTLYATYGTDTDILFGIPFQYNHGVQAIVEAVLRELETEGVKGG